MYKKEAKKVVKKLIDDASVTKKSRRQFRVITQQLDAAGCYFAPNIVNGELDGWNLMANGLHWSFLTDGLNFSKLQGVAINIDDILAQA